MSNTDVALNNAVLIVNPADQAVLIINKANMASYPGYRYVGGTRSDVFRMTPAERLLLLYIGAWHAIFVHGVSPQSVDAALRVVPEYRETLTTDFSPASHHRFNTSSDASSAAGY